MASNITFFDTANTFLDVTAGVNANLNNSLGILLMFALFVIVFIMFQRYEFRQIMLFEGYIMFMIGLLMVTIGWLSVSYFIIPVLLLAFAIYINRN